MKINQLRYFGLLCCVMPGIAAAVNTPIENLVDKLKAINSFSAQFVQSIEDESNQKIDSTKGELYVQRPGLFHWKSQSPDEILVVADGDFLWTYDIDLEQVTKQNMKQAIKHSPAALLAGDLESIQEDFDVSNFDCGAQYECYRLKPKEADALFAKVDVYWSSKGLQKIELEDPFGQLVSTDFSKVSVNPSLSRKLFQFAPPNGVDVILSNQ